MKNLLIVLGRHIRDLRSAKAWSQEEFAHISGLHRTYIGQIERGEKNISFGNLAKVASVLGVSLSDLLSGLEDGGPPRKATPKRQPGNQNLGDARSSRRMLEIQNLVRRLSHQRAAMDETILVLEEIAEGGGSQTDRPVGGNSKTRGAPKK